MTLSPNICVRVGIILLLVLVLFKQPADAQLAEGEVRVTVRDPSGQPVPAVLLLTSRNPLFEAEIKADFMGRARIVRVPQGAYGLSVKHPGFSVFSQVVEIRSAVPQELSVILKVDAPTTEVIVRDIAPLLDPSQPALLLNAGRQQLRETFGTTLGRSTTDVITTMPGWLLEANAVLHPRGSEYDTQYVIDGMPLYDNRSLAFAPAFENDEFEAVNIMTAGIPAEYGRRLGGVIALDSRRIDGAGQNSEISLQRSSFGTYMGALSHQHRTERSAISVGIHGGYTNRYLDPPSLENYTNKASARGLNLRFDQDLSDRDRLTFYLRSNRTGFLVPNDLVQQAAGQRQDRSTEETAGQAHFQHTFSSNKLASIRGMVRDLTARLWSNPLSTPIWVDQDRGFREGALNSSFTLEGERHTLKVGGDLRVNTIRESFQFAEPDELPEVDLHFHDRRRSTEASLFIQDHVRLGNFAAAVGLRYDHYRLLITDSAFSPRVALSYYIPRADLLLRASYDRIFQPPPIENLLLSSAAPRLHIDHVEDALAVPASRANFFEVGIRKPIANRVRLDVSHYWRTFKNYIDDDVFLNTGLSFPITFDTARISGTEVRLEMPQWRGISAFLSYANMHGTAASPVTGGLFIEGGDAEELRTGVSRFPITQDQRNTLAAQVRFEPNRRMWTIGGIRYGSGLPVELEEADDDDDEPASRSTQPISQAILDRVNFDRGRIRPNLSFDLGAGLRVWEHDSQSASLQVDVRNITDRLNVINFSGLFSGTALAPGRQVSFALKLRF